MQQPGAFPTLRTTNRLGDTAGKSSAKTILHNNVASSIYDVKFYPYLAPEEDVVFAAVTAREIFVCRPNANSKDPYDILRVFRDPQDDASLNSVVWTQDLKTGHPLLCVAGAGSSKIKVLNVTTGELVRVINGHGGAINDLAISPLSPAILASASADYTVRLWNLDMKYEKQPCAAILAGAGHKQPVLALGFHPNGRYLLSGGTDTMVNLWAVPELPDAKAGTDKLNTVYYPHFSSIEVHSDYVDCIRFHGDLILSHAASTSTQNDGNNILLWKIDGFSSADPIPADPPLPGPGIFTRSAFGSRFQRILTFDMPHTKPFYMRFGLFSQPGHDVMLAMGNQQSRFSFWNLTKLETGPDGTEGAPPKGALGGTGVGGKKKRGRGRPPNSAYSNGNKNKADNAGGEELSATVALPSDLSTGNGGEAGNSHSVNATALTKNSTTKDDQGKAEDRGDDDEEDEDDASIALSDPRFQVHDPFFPIAPHATSTVPRYEFSTRQVAWSNCGKWCVAVGDFSLMCIFKRWD